MSIYLWTSLAVSLAVNATAVMSYIADPGRSVVKRWWKQFTKDTGKYYNVLFITTDGTIREEYPKKEEDGSFTIDGARYAPNNRAKLLYKSFQTYLVHEGKSEVLDPLNLASGSITAEAVERIILNAEQSKIIDKIQNLLMYAGIGVAIVGAGVLAMLYFQWNVYDVVVQQGAQIAAN
jgi:hypothetical protein